MASLALYENAANISIHLQHYLEKIKYWMKNWRIKTNTSESIRVQVTTKRVTCPPGILNYCLLPQNDEVKYHSTYRYRCVTWASHKWQKNYNCSKNVSTPYNLSVFKHFLIWCLSYQPLFMQINSFYHTAFININKECWCLCIFRMFVSSNILPNV